MAIQTADSFGKITITEFYKYFEIPCSLTKIQANKLLQWMTLVSDNKADEEELADEE